MKTIHVSYSDYLAEADILVIDTKQDIGNQCGLTLTDDLGNEYELLGPAFFTGFNVAKTDPSYSLKPLSRYHGNPITELHIAD